jgi:hypothetical protein
VRTDTHEQPAPAPTRRSRERAARELDAIVESRLFRALCEPARIGILKLLTVNGRSDIATIAVVAQLEDVLERFRKLIPLCCPEDASRASPTKASEG